MRAGSVNIRALAAATFLLLVTSSYAADVTIVAVVEREAQTHEANVRTAVDYVNEEDAGPLKDHQVTLEILTPSDNDSFVAMKEVCDQLSSGIDVMIDLSSRYVTATLRPLAGAMGIPHVSSVDPSLYDWNAGQEYQTSVNIEPPSSVMLNVIRDIVSSENLTNVGILYDQTFDLDNKPKRLLRNIPAQHLYLRMGWSADVINDQLEKIKSAELRYIFLACSAESASAFLGQANAAGMMGFKYTWYVLTMDAVVNCMECQIPSSVVVMTGIRNNANTARYVAFKRAEIQIQAPTLTFDVDDIEMSAAFQFDLVNMMGEALATLIDGNQWQRISYPDCYTFQDTDPQALAQANQLRNTLKQTQYSGVFGAFEWTGNVARQMISLDIKRIQFSGGSVLSETTIGNWTLDNLNAFEGSITKKNVKKSYRITTLKEPPFVFKSVDHPGDSVTHVYFNQETGYYYYGYCIDLIFHINATMEFEFTVDEPEDGAYGTMQQDGTWDGMINELLQDKADIIVAPLSVMAERENVIDFTVPYYDLVGITILMKKPRFEYSVFRFMSVLEDAVWGCVFSAFIIVSVLLAVFDKFSPYSYQNNRTTWDGQGDEPRVFTLKEGLWFCMTSLTPQGGGEAPRALSGRLVAATWWMFGFIMIATYTANLAAFLTVSRLEQPIESLNDLAKQFKTKYAPQLSTSSETYFRRMADIEEKFYTIWKTMSLNDSLDQVERAKLAVWDYPVSDKFTNMWVSMEESGFPKTFEEAIKRIKNDDEDFAFIGDATQNKYATLTDCDLWEVGEEFSRKPYALAVQDGSPLKNELSSVILQLLNQRVLEDLKTFWWEFDRKVCAKIEDESDGISIYNIGGVFLVIFIGVGLGLLTLGFEYYWYRVRPGSSVVKRDAALEAKANGAAVGLTKEENGSVIKGHDNFAYDSRPLT